MIPTVGRTTEEMLLMVPNTIREAALGLGLPNWRSVSIDHGEDCFARNYHRLHARVCACGGRNSAPDLYSIRQCVLEHRSESAD